MAKFDHNEFYEWCRYMAKDNILFISEYNMPKDFEKIWSKKDRISGINTNNRDNVKRTEKLFLLF